TATSFSTTLQGSRSSTAGYGFASWRARAPSSLRLSSAKDLPNSVPISWFALRLQVGCPLTAFNSGPTPFLSISATSLGPFADYAVQAPAAHVLRTAAARAGRL